MDKTAIKNFAVWARRKLIEDIRQKAFEIGISEKEIKKPQVETSDTMIIDGRTLNKTEMAQRRSLVSRINEKGYENVIEEVAYTWFNRFIALRFMEVNEYLPTGVRVLSSHEPGKTEPDIIKEALHVDLSIDKEHVYKLQDTNDTEGLYRYLLVKQCNKLNEILPGLFEKIEDYTEILLPSNLLNEGSVIRQLVESISTDDFDVKENGQVEIIGWLYQYYNTELKDDTFAKLKSNVKITKERIPAATQLFTPDWIVRYMVENSLGRLWIEHLQANEDKVSDFNNMDFSDFTFNTLTQQQKIDSIKSNWKYYLEEAEQEPDVKAQLEKLREDRKNIRPEAIKVIDPCMGSGHILVYAFDVLMDIYKSCGYAEREAAKSILENNLYGLDIDDRAYQLAYFAVMMKARSYSRRILNEGIKPNLCAIQESVDSGQWLVVSGQLAMDDMVFETANYLIDVFKDAKEYGSILNIEQRDYEALERYIERIEKYGGKDFFEIDYINRIKDFMPMLIKQAKIMSQKYDVVVTNPPYMGNKSMSSSLYEFLSSNYQKSKMDLYTAFIEKGIKLCCVNGYTAMVTQQSWMYLPSYEKLRIELLSNYQLNSLLHLGARAFEEISGEVVQVSAFTFKKSNCKKYISSFCRLIDKTTSDEKERSFLIRKDIYTLPCNIFLKINGTPISYWLSDNFFELLIKKDSLTKQCTTKQGLKSSDDKRFFRLWYEVDKTNIEFRAFNSNLAKQSSNKWFPLNKGGSTKWYGDINYVVNWYNDGQEIKSYAAKLYKSFSRTITSIDYYFEECISWPQISMNTPNFRLIPKGFIFNAAGPSLFSNNNGLRFMLALLNTKITGVLLSAINPTINFCVGDILKIPYIYETQYEKVVNKLVNQNIDYAKTDWDNFETSWDFTKHPLVQLCHGVTDKTGQETAYIEDAFIEWEFDCNERFNQLKSNEEELNRIFIEIYGLQDELTPEVEEKDVTIRKADLQRDIKSFISYAVGCMFGRYSLDQEGLAFAGGDFDPSKYTTFIADMDNIIPITDEEYFDDDMVTRFIEFVKIAFSEETLEENLDFIANALGNKGNTSRETIRQYFIKDFYKDHVKTYQKRPIYWLFDSGKQDGFKALIYMHRYDEFTAAKVRTDYLHRLQKAYESEVKRIDFVISSNASDREKAIARKKKENILKQLEECLQYDQIIAHIANQRIKIDLDDGVVVNYAKFQEVEVPQGEGKKPLKADLFAKI